MTATKCDPQLHGDFAILTQWLQTGIRRGCVGAPWVGTFPRYVWSHEGGVFYEAREVVPGRGQYKGYALSDDEVPESLVRFFG